MQIRIKSEEEYLNAIESLEILGYNVAKIKYWSCIGSLSLNKYNNCWNTSSEDEGVSLSEFLRNAEYRNHQPKSLEKILDAVKELVLYKDKQYGNSANNPLNIFGSKCKYGYRLDEKLSRVQNCNTLRKNDLVDLLGGMLLVCQEFGWDDFSEFKD